jgi:hypothetical protein
MLLIALLIIGRLTMNKQAIELRFLSDRFLKWVKINFTLTPFFLANIKTLRRSEYPVPQRTR